MDIEQISKEYEKSMIKTDLLNVISQLVLDSRYTKEMAAEELLKTVKKVEAIS